MVTTSGVATDCFSTATLRRCSSFRCFRVIFFGAGFAPFSVASLSSVPSSVRASSSSSVASCEADPEAESCTSELLLPKRANTSANWLATPSSTCLRSSDTVYSISTSSFTASVELEEEEEELSESDVARSNLELLRRVFVDDGEVLCEVSAFEEEEEEEEGSLLSVLCWFFCSFCSFFLRFFFLLRRLRLESFLRAGGGFDVEAVEPLVCAIIMLEMQSSLDSWW
mmetsp:Transcript_5620/g.14232  ORF Transcript_5620/g.14232 Transcript_5620/m.14232 type:complete len:226 (+) Transcript_5620:1167-1844(+)